MERYDRRQSEDGDEDEARDPRGSAQRDYDRLLHSDYLRRLAETTQVVEAGDGHGFHNRLTHSLEVSQIGRRLAEQVVHNEKAIARDLHVDPEVVAAAGLAHDLGHPPFGHIGEEVLDRCVKAAGDLEGFEGNAQSFRIVCKLANHRLEMEGLNLTAATLNATLKYPWARDTRKQGADAFRELKFGYFESERDEFEWARGVAPTRETKTAEAELMDWADDIAYSIYDVDDFFCAGLIPLDWVARPGDERERFLENTLKLWEADAATGKGRKAPRRAVFDRASGFFLALFPLRDERYVGSRAQRRRLSGWRSQLVTRFMEGISLRKPTLRNPATVSTAEDIETEIRLFKALTKYYVVGGSGLAQIQPGQQKILGDLFEILLEASRNKHGEMRILPQSAQESLTKLERDFGRPAPDAMLGRLVADTLAGLTEKQVTGLYGRLAGAAPGSVLDPPVR